MNSGLWTSLCPVSSARPRQPAAPSAQLSREDSLSHDVPAAKLIAMVHTTHTHGMVGPFSHSWREAEQKYRHPVERATKAKHGRGIPR